MHDLLTADHQASGGAPKRRGALGHDLSKTQGARCAATRRTCSARFPCYSNSRRRGGSRLRDATLTPPIALSQRTTCDSGPTRRRSELRSRSRCHSRERRLVAPSSSRTCDAPRRRRLLDHRRGAIGGAAALPRWRSPARSRTTSPLAGESGHDIDVDAARALPLPGQRESRRPRWLRVHAPTRTHVWRPLMTSVSQLAEAVG